MTHWTVTTFVDVILGFLITLICSSAVHRLLNYFQAEIV